MKGNQKIPFYIFIIYKNKHMVNLSEYLTESCEPEIKVWDQHHKTVYDYRSCNPRDCNFFKPEDFNQVTTHILHIWFEKTPYGKELKKRALQAKKDKSYLEFMKEVNKEMNIELLFETNPTIGTVRLQFDNYLLSIMTRTDNPKQIEMRLTNPRGKEIACTY